MVTNKAILWIDLSGIAIVLAIGLALFSYASQPFRQGERMEELQQAIATMEKDAAAMDARIEQERARLTGQKAELTSAGKLPEVAPVAEYQAKLAELATGSGVRITSFAPIADREYPGLMEKRFTFDARGETANVLRFLRAVETDPSWADIGYLTLARATAPGETGRERTLGFVISLFSSPKTQAQQPEGT